MASIQTSLAHPLPFKMVDRRPHHRQGLTIVLKIGTSSICDPVTHYPLLANLSSVAIAAVGQGKLMSLYDTLFSQFNQPVAQILLTRNDLADRTQYINACNTFDQLLEMDVIPIVNENDTISPAEIKFGDNDTLSAITAGMINADYLFLLTDVDCLYTDNPRSNPEAKAVRVVEDIAALREQIKVTAPGTSLGTGATAAGVTTFIARGSTPANVIKIVDEVSVFNSRANTPIDPAMRSKSSPTASEGSPSATIRVGNIGKSTDLLYTCFLAKRNPLRDRKWWIRHGVHNAGTIAIDRGAVRALLNHKGSLFSAGIVDVQGTFVAQQGIRIVYAYKDASDASEQYLEIGHGLVNYSSMEIVRIKGRHSWEIGELLGYADAECVVHRDNLARTLTFDDWKKWEKEHTKALNE
ncbi:Aspartate/glutamate/uridylate kinase [Syncephalis fuscata]|nr:Aspartate/glutamate/uridylate kinase [Syncephalis fuscata]